MKQSPVKIIAVCFFSISCLLPMRAQTQASASALTRTYDGVISSYFASKYGGIQIFVPDDITCGDTISGSIFIEAGGHAASDVKHNENELNKYTFEISSNGQLLRSLPTSLNAFRMSLPAQCSSIDISLKDKHGVVVGTASSPVNQTAPDVLKDKTFKMFNLVGQAGRPFQCWGPLDGNFDNISVSLGTKEVQKLAESPRKLVGLSPTDISGPTTIQIKGHHFVISHPYTVLSVSINSPKTTLVKDEQTTVSVQVDGLSGLPSPVTLLVENRTPQIVDLSGGNQQQLQLSAQAGPFVQTFNVKALQPGSFNLIAYLVGQH